MLKKYLWFVCCVALLGNSFGSLTYAQSGRVSARGDRIRNSLAQRSNTLPGNKSEDAQGSSTITLRETGKVTNDARGGVGQIGHSNNLSKGDKIVGIALLSGLILSAIIIVDSGF